VIFILAAMLLLLIVGSAAAEERHTAVIHCDGGGFVGNAKSGKKGTVTVKPGTEVEAQNGDRWTIAELVKLPDFRLERAAMRFDVISVNGLALRYALTCGAIRSASQTVRTGKNLWDVTEPIAAWMEKPKEELKLIPLFDKNPWGMKVDDYTCTLQLTFTTSAELPDFPMDRVLYSALYENSLDLL
jgi:hypothetical protein